MISGLLLVGLLGIFWAGYSVAYSQARTAATRKVLFSQNEQTTLSGTVRNIDSHSITIEDTHKHQTTYQVTGDTLITMHGATIGLADIAKKRTVSVTSKNGTASSITLQ